MKPKKKGIAKPYNSGVIKLMNSDYEDRVQGVGHVGLEQVASGEEVLQGFKEVTCGHRLVVVEVIVAWL